MLGVYYKVRMNNAPVLIKWDDTYSVGITAIDMQHNMMMLMINELNDSITRLDESGAVLKTLTGLANYTAEHFATEEKFFSDFSYPWSATHKAEHQVFKQKLSDLSQEYQQGCKSLTCEVFVELSDWMKNHIISKDKTYSYFFLKKGLS